MNENSELLTCRSCGWSWSWGWSGCRFYWSIPCGLAGFFVIIIRLHMRMTVRIGGRLKKIGKIPVHHLFDIQTIHQAYHSSFITVTWLEKNYKAIVLIFCSGYFPDHRPFRFPDKNTSPTFYCFFLALGLNEFLNFSTNMLRKKDAL